MRGPGAGRTGRSNLRDRERLRLLILAPNVCGDDPHGSSPCQARKNVFVSPTCTDGERSWS
ncbi:hypothetical protein FTUN_0061 [Frigoriglobus tundricola]|uniref:Uncharacterized protein n=1 Tax=Frigoriglobus tundricola TaxID=2774151 RepID=A0A6M5YEX5_9BACT|nr:hypothetical protein FTUN_0061 [Frigoriglobus tundricola]